MSTALVDIDELADALETIRAEYEDSYPEWLRFASDATAYADELGVAVSFYGPNEHMPVVRYQKLRADQLISASFEELTADHLRVLIEFAQEAL